MSLFYYLNPTPCTPSNNVKSFSDKKSLTQYSPRGQTEESIDSLKDASYLIYKSGFEICLGISSFSV